EKGVPLVFERSPDVPRYVWVDHLKLREVLLNLLSNALKFTAEGSVTLRVYPLAPDAGPAVGLSFAVADTGPGIAPEELGRVFEAFVQSQAGRQASEGTGLGLAISR